MAELYYNPSDTICAISTPAGCGGIAVVRLSGKDALAIADKVWRGKPLSAQNSHTAHLGRVVDSHGQTVDQTVATIFRSPASYTGEDTVEFGVHGSRWIQRNILRVLTAAGARLALPGEFTRRAYASGRIDLVQAEGIADLIAANSHAAHRAAIAQMRGGVSHRLEELRQKLVNFASLLELELDFSDQDVEFVDRSTLINLGEEIDSELTRLEASFTTGTAVKEGFPAVLIGAVNSGKSSLLNAIVDEERAIVSDIPGTTRDVVEDRLEIGDHLVRFLDTAGLRQTHDTIEALGIERSRKEAAKAAVIIYVVDSANPEPPAQTTAATAAIPRQRLIVALNKTDLNPAADTLKAQTAQTLGIDPENIIATSAKTGEGINRLLSAIDSIITQQCDSAGDILISTARHAEAIHDARISNTAAITALRNQIPADLVAQDLRETLHHISTITGTITTPEILTTIFKSFCIGK